MSGKPSKIPPPVKMPMPMPAQPVTAQPVNRNPAYGHKLNNAQGQPPRRHSNNKH